MGLISKIRFQFNITMESIKEIPGILLDETVLS